jgi:hypothetical protein
MALAIIQDWPEEETERSTTNYDAVTERLMAQDPVDGLIVHTAGFTGNGFRIFDVWESRGHYDRFIADRLMPIMAEVGDSNPVMPVITEYELHNVVTV